MNDKARELLSRCLRRFNKSSHECSQLVEEIELYLAEPEKKQEPLSGEYIAHQHFKDYFTTVGYQSFLNGVRFAERHHGIGETK